MKVETKSERVETVVDIAPKYEGTPINANPFIDSPSEFLSKKVVIELRKVPEFVGVFSDFIDAYPRADYQARNLPALRIYDKGYVKSFDSWFIEGDLYLDILLPASLRRIENQEVPDVLSSALLQQFRRPSFFNTLVAEIPGLNELGKRFEVDKALGFEWGENIVPLTQIRANFRIDLREWDNYLEQTDRTKDEPFNKTLANLQSLYGVIEGYKEEELNITIGINQGV